jgi:hypothetical protein
MALSECVHQSAQLALTTAAGNARKFKSPTYSALIASLLYEELNKELRGTETDDVDKRDLLRFRSMWREPCVKSFRCSS